MTIRHLILACLPMLCCPLSAAPASPFLASMKPAREAAFDEVVLMWFERARSIIEYGMTHIGIATAADIEKACGPAALITYKGKECLSYRAFQYDPGKGEPTLPKGIEYEGSWDLSLDEGLSEVVFLFDKTGKLKNIILR